MNWIAVIGLFILITYYVTKFVSAYYKHGPRRKSMRRNESVMDKDLGDIAWGRVIGVGALALVVLIVLFGSFYTVGAGERGVVLTFGEASLDAKEPGLHWKIPVAQRAVKMTVQTQKYEAGASAASKDLQIVTSQVAVNYHLTPDTAPMLYRDIGMGYQDRVIQPAVQEVVKATTARFTAEELITRRDEVKNAVREALIERLSGRGIQVEDISMTEFDFSESFNAAIEAKVTADQLRMKAERDLERIEVEALQVKAKAEGERDAQIAKAEGEARSIALIEEQLSKSPRYIEYYGVTKWDGVLPRVTGGAVPFVNVEGAVS